MAKELDLTDVAQCIEHEGFDYCFVHYSSFEEVKDEKFHELRAAYVAAANDLELYINKHSSIKF